MSHRLFILSVMGTLLAANWLARPACAAEGTSLELTKTALHQYEGGPPLPASFEFFPGDIVFATFRIGGFKTVERNDEDKYQLIYSIEAEDPQGIPIKEEAEGALAGEMTPQDVKRKWLPLVRYDLLVPPAAPSGEYRILVKIDDRLGEQEAEGAIRFKVKGREVEPSETLVLRDFHFYRNETSMQPLPRAVYRAGSSVWARFDITGYRFGEGNKLSIDYGIKVLRASGKTLFEQAVAAAEERDSFYPERHIQGGLSLNLTRDLSPGEYTIIVTVRDKIGDQTHKESHTITVE